MIQKFVENVWVYSRNNFILWVLKLMGDINYYYTTLKFTDKHLYERNMRKSVTGYVELRYTRYPEVQLFTLNFNYIPLSLLRTGILNILVLHFFFFLGVHTHACKKKKLKHFHSHRSFSFTQTFPRSTNNSKLLTN